MSFLTKPMRITGIWKQLDIRCYTIDRMNETSIVGSFALHVLKKPHIRIRGF